jgi:hypothetical protein
MNENDYFKYFDLVNSNNKLFETSNLNLLTNYLF